MAAGIEVDDRLVRAVTRGYRSSSDRATVDLVSRRLVVEPSGARG